MKSTTMFKFAVAISVVVCVAAGIYIFGTKGSSEGDDREIGYVESVLEIRPADVIRSIVETDYDGYATDRMDRVLNDISMLSDVDEAIDEFLSCCTDEDLREVFYTTDRDIIKSNIKGCVDSYTDNVCRVLEPRLDQCGFRHYIQRVDDTNRIYVKVSNVDDPERVKRLLSSDGNVEFWSVGSLYEVQAIRGDIAQSNMLGDIELQYDNAYAPYSVGIVKESDKERVTEILMNPENRGLLPYGVKLAWENKTIEGENFDWYRLVVLSGRVPLMDGSGIVNAEAESVDPSRGGGFLISLSMDGESARKWANITANNVGKQIAIVMDDIVYSAPIVNQRIENGESSISGNFTRQEAEDLASVLWSGRLPVAPVIVIFEVSER